ncbi:MAG TPA: KH domain-containing protein [Acidobacteriaceae bacterium]
MAVAESQIAEVCVLMSLIVRAIVSNKDAVHVSSRLSPDGSTIIRIKVAQGPDKGKLIGKQGRTARSLRVIFQAIAQGQGQHYQLDIDGGDFDGLVMRQDNWRN